MSSFRACAALGSGTHFDVVLTAELSLMHLCLSFIRLAVLLLTFCIATAHAQDRYSPFVPTDESDVVRMLKLADVGEGDVVFDLGSGDGRIVLEAARMHPRAQGRGIEMDPKLVRESAAR